MKKGDLIFEQNTATMREGAVTLLDVLGWKGIWQRRSDAVSTLKELIDTSRIIKEILVDEGGEIESAFTGLEAAVTGISDTIALRTYGEPFATLNFHTFMTKIMLTEFLEEGLLLRGATSYGRFSASENVLIGPAVDEVASWYEAVDWAGIIFTPSALFQSDLSGFSKAVRRYKVNVKNVGLIETLCVDWSSPWVTGEGGAAGLGTKSKGEVKEQLLRLFLESQPITPDLAAKFSNTLAFFEKCTEGK